MSSNPSNIRYTNNRLFFCSNNMFYNIKTCNGIQSLEPPKKARIFSKQNQMTRSQLRNWTSKFKYR